MAAKEPIRVLVTGAAGQIAYSLVYMIARGEMFGADQPIILHLLDITPAMVAVDGVVLELQDCAFTTLADIVATDNLDIAFSNIDVALMVGAMPRRDGMERKDLLAANVKIFKEQGNALDRLAKKTVKVLVVGNPANTNALVMSKFAPSIPRENFTALTQLDHNRAQAQIALRLKLRSDAVKNVIIWGNHSNTQFPDVSHATVVGADGSVKTVEDAVQDLPWLRGAFISTVQTRGAAVIKARKLSSAISAAKAICDHVRLWWYGTPAGEHTSMAVFSNGHYGLPEGLMFSFPVTIKDQKISVVEGLPISEFARGLLAKTTDELVEERALAYSITDAPAL